LPSTITKKVVKLSESDKVRVTLSSLSRAGFCATRTERYGVKGTQPSPKGSPFGCLCCFRVAEVREISSAQAYGETTEAVTSSKNTKYPVPAGIKFPKITFSLSPFKKSFFLYNAA